MRWRPREGARIARSGEHGQSAVEYLVAVALIALALTIGPDSVLERLFRSVDRHYQGYVHALSLP